MVEHNKKNQQIRENSEEQALLKLEKSVELLSEQEIKKKIKLWARRIEQFATLKKKTRAMELYAELKVMVKIYHQKSKLQQATPFVCKSAATRKVKKYIREIDLGEHQLEDYDLQEIVNEKDILFRFPSDEDSVYQMYDIARQKFALLPLNEMEKVNLDLAINEAIGNAQRHGHNFQAELAIEFRYLHQEDKLVMWVTDQGEGFDYKAVLEKKKNSNAITEARQRYQEGGYGGLGMMMMLKCMDSVEYNSTGNQIILTKYLGEAAQKFRDQTLANADTGSNQLS